MLRRTTGQWLTDAGVFILPSLVGAAIYLPNGLLMPSRLVILALTATAAWRFLRRPARNPVLAGVVAVSAVFLVFGLLGAVRFPEACSWRTGRSLDSRR